MRSDLMSVDCLVITYSRMRSNIANQIWRIRGNPFGRQGTKMSKAPADANHDHARHRIAATHGGCIPR